MSEVGLRRFYAIAEESIEKPSISISNKSCLILTQPAFGGVPVCERSECPAASADDALPLCLTTPLQRMWSGRCLLHDMKHVERREHGECLGYETQSQWDGKTQSQLVLGVISLQQSRLSPPDLDHTLCAPFRILPGLLFVWGRIVLPANVFMPQLPADVPVQRKFGPKENTCQDSSRGHNLSSSDSHRFCSPGLQKPPLHLPLWHDLDTMSDSSLWTVLSNFNMPHFFSGARLRRSQRYHPKPIEVTLLFVLCCFLVRVL